MEFTRKFGESSQRRHNYLKSHGIPSPKTCLQIELGINYIQNNVNTKKPRTYHVQKMKKQKIIKNLFFMQLRNL